MRHFATTLVALLAAVPFLAPAQDPKPTPAPKPAATAAKPDGLVDGTYGYSMRSPVFAKLQPGATGMVAFFSAPPKDDFSANVNVLVQEVTTTRAEYRKGTEMQFEQLGYEVHSMEERDVGGHPALVFDYSGVQDGRELRFLGLAVVTQKRVFLLTGTAPAKDWKSYEKPFRDSLLSFVAPK
jgi:hypothetical protein